MRRSTRASILAALIALASVTGGAALAQDPEPGELLIEEYDDTQYPIVRLAVSVPTVLIGSDLVSADFAIFEGTVERPVAVQRVPTDDLQVVLLLDASTSMSGAPIDGAKEAALGFVDAMPAGVEVAVVAFASQPEVLAGFTTDLDQVSEAIAGLSVGGETALYDGLAAGAGLFEDIEGHRRILLLLSDGGDTVSGATLDDAIAGLLDVDVGFYAVELQSPENDSAALAQLGEATGGVVVSAADPEALTQVFDTVAGQIVNRYVLTFASTAFGLTEIVVEVQADGVVATASQDVRFPDPPPPSVAPSRSEPAPITSVVTTPSPTIPVALRDGAVRPIGFWESSTAFWLGLAAMFLAFSAMLLSTGMVRPQRSTGLIVQDVKQRFAASDSRMLSGLASRVTQLADRLVSRRGSSRTPEISLLEKAGLHLRPGELVVVSAAVSLTMLALGMVFAGPAVGMMLAGVALMAIRLWLGQKATKRQQAFGEQMADVLQLMSGSIRAGFGLMQAIDTVAHEVPAPAGEEFQRVKIETQLGRDRNETLLAMAARVGSEDLKWVVEAIEIHRSVGGDLADILDAVTDTIRDRNRIRRRIETLSAEGKVTAMVLTILPFALAGVIYAINPTYLSELVTTGAGQVLIGAGFFAMVIGMFWMRHITRLKF